jgi:hypothetical protein
MAGMKATWLGFAVLGLGSACGGASAPATDGAEVQQRLHHVAAEHAESSKKLANVPPAHRSECETTAGDCLLQVAERRDKLASLHRLSSCEQFTDTDGKTRCIAEQLSERGHSKEAADYYGLANWCLAKVVTCTSQRAEQARLAALEARFQTRKQELETSAEGVNAWNSVELVHAKVEYLRSTLPPRAAAVCEPEPSVATCQKRFEAAEQALHEQLRREDYDAKAAISSYATVKQIEASCEEPELACLSSAVASYGVFPEARKWVDRNLALLAERQALTSLVSAEAQSECLASPQQAHQPRIVEAYTTYSRQTVLFFRMQLDKAFLSMHEAQVRCLSTRSKAATTPPVKMTQRTP